MHFITPRRRCARVSLIAFVACGCSSPLGPGTGSQIEQRGAASGIGGADARDLTAEGCLRPPRSSLFTVGEGCGWALVEAAPAVARGGLELRSLRAGSLDASVVLPLPSWCEAPESCTVAGGHVGQRILLRYQQRPSAPEGVATREGLWLSLEPGADAAGVLVDPWLGVPWIDRGVFRGPSRYWRPRACGGRVAFEESAHPALPPIAGRSGELREDRIMFAERSAGAAERSCADVVFGESVRSRGPAPR